MSTAVAPTRSAAAAAPALAARLRDVRVGVRADLEITRHVFRGEPAYVVRDPVTFQSHRLDPADYDALARLHADVPLSQHFEQHVAAGRFAPDQAEEYFQFIFSLHRLGFLALPMADDKGLYRRHQQRAHSRRRAWLLSFISLRVPLVNPDRFLAATLPQVRWLFSPAFFCIWILFMLMAGGVAWARAADLYEPIGGLLSAQSLPITWTMLIVLKIWHELGHAYACKHFGVHVPEIGANIMLLTPCAYVDASAAWGLPRKRDRIIISLAGMYFESMCAGIAVLVWAFTPPGLLSSVAYNVIFVAGVVTVLFNINPLMKFDGYYILSDLLELPNLAQRARRLILNHAKRHLLGVKTSNEPERAPWLLACYGVGALVFQTMLLFSICVLLATKFFLVGVTAAALYVGSSLGRAVTGFVRYVLWSEETRPVRRRALAVATACIVLPIGILALVPADTGVVAPARVGAAEELTLRADGAGFLELLAREPHVEAGALLARLANDETTQALAIAELELESARLRVAALEFSDPPRARGEQAALAGLVAQRDARLRERDALLVRAPFAGRVVQGLRAQDDGRFLRPGDALATIVRGPAQVRALLSELDYASLALGVGSSAEFRPADAPHRTLRGTVTRISPAGSRSISIASLTQEGGGDIAIDPATSEAQQSYFEVVITLQPDPAGVPAHGVSGRVRLPSRGESLGRTAYRAVRRFIDRLARG